VSIQIRANGNSVAIGPLAAGATCDLSLKSRGVATVLT
jgi:hypothetical protein